MQCLHGEERPLIGSGQLPQLVEMHLRPLGVAVKAAQQARRSPILVEKASVDRGRNRSGDRHSAR
jgi:hypothetical protein